MVHFTYFLTAPKIWRCHKLGSWGLTCWSPATNGRFCASDMTVSDYLNKLWVKELAVTVKTSGRMMLTSLWYEQHVEHDSASCLLTSRLGVCTKTGPRGQCVTSCDSHRDFKGADQLHGWRQVAMCTRMGFALDSDLRPVDFPQNHPKWL